MKNSFSVANNQKLLAYRQKSLLKSGIIVSKEKEDSLLEKVKSESPFMGVVPLKCKLGAYYFLNLDDDGVADYLFWFGCFGYERTSAVLFTHLAMSASLVLDLGSYTGYYSLLSSVLAGNNNTFAVEANPLNFHRLCENLKLNSSQATPCNYALAPESEKSENVKIFYNKNLRVLDTGSFAKSESAEILPQKGNKTDVFIVPAVTIQDLQLPPVEKSDSFVLVKLDVEGLEIPLLGDIIRYFSVENIIIFVEILSSTSFNLMCSQLTLSRKGLSVAYIDEYRQKITMQDDLSYSRQSGSRNFIIGSSQLVSQICALSPNDLLRKYE